MIFFVSASIASAAAAGQLSYTPLEPFDAWHAQAGAYSDFAFYLNTIFKLLITLGALFAVVMLVVAGIGYMVSEAAVDIEKAKQRAKAALWGLLLLTGCWLILYTINPNLLNFNLNIPMAPGAPSSSVSGGATPNPPATADLLSQINNTFANNEATKNRTVTSATPYQNGILNTEDNNKLISQCEGTGFLGYKLTQLPGSDYGFPEQTVYACSRPNVF